MDTVQVRNRKAEQSEATRTDLVNAARELFAERGYVETATDEIVQQAGVTRGALYHQFRDKKDLFHAVYEQVQIEIIAAILAETGKVFQLGWEARMKGACAAFLDFYMDAGRRQIALQDAPSVLDWDTRNEIHMKHGLGAMATALQQAIADGAFVEQPAQPLAHILHGALNEGAMAIGRSKDPTAQRIAVGAAIDRLLDGLRPGIPEG